MSNQRLRQDLARIRDAALAAVDPYKAVMRHLTLTEQELLILRDAGRALMLPQSTGRRVMLAVGKAAPAMAAAMVDRLGGLLSRGLVVTKYGHVQSYGATFPDFVRVIETGHPVPDAAGVMAAHEAMALLRSLGPEDTAFVLLSGGASALLPAPASGVTLSELQRTTELLLRAGATIVELNTVRKHLSQLKGGQMAKLAHPARVLSFILSDVVGDRLDVIASGPTAPDPTTFAQALEVLKRYRLMEQAPDSVVAHLRAGAQGLWPETPKPGDALFDRVDNLIIGSNLHASRAAVEEARALGYHSLLLTTFVEGEAREISKVAVALAKGEHFHNHPVPRPACLVWGGETTVTVRGQGKGGRNQELALAAALGLAGLENVALLALATDGTDGPTDAAGAVVDGNTVQRALAKGWDCRTALDDNNAYPVLEAAGDLLRLGPTGTNVNDLLVLLVA